MTCANLPARYVEIKDATHFSFMSICKPGAIEMLEEDAPGDGVICRDGENARSREEIQREVVGLVTVFLEKAASGGENNPKPNIASTNAFAGKPAPTDGGMGSSRLF